jgi:hypothetical protein
LDEGDGVGGFLVEEVSMLGEDQVVFLEDRVELVSVEIPGNAAGGGERDERGLGPNTLARSSEQPPISA